MNSSHLRTASIQSEATTFADQLNRILHRAAHLLPVQGPIGVFVHHNTLHAFQHLPFEEAVVRASQIFGAEPYLQEEEFQAELLRRRIQDCDLRHVIYAEPDALVLAQGLTRRELRFRILSRGIETPAESTLEWLLEEQGLVASEADRDFLAAATDLLKDFQPPPATENFERIDCDEAIHPLLVRLCSVYLDQGIAYWPMPGRDRGFWSASRELLGQGGVFLPLALDGLKEAARRYPENSLAALAQALTALKLPADAWEAAIQAELLAMPGWPGMFYCLETNPGLAPHISLPATLADYLAVRFLLIACAHANGAARHTAPRPAPGIHFYTYLVMQVLRAVGVNRAVVENLSAAERATLRDEILAFDQLERRRLYHAAYEHRHREEVLRPLVRHRQAGLRKVEGRPAAQVFFCMDEREEAIRRHLEEVDPAIETFGAAGYFGVAMHYQGVDDPHAVDLCPVVIKPAHAVREKAASGQEDLLAQRMTWRRRWASLLHNGYISSRTLVRGWLSTVALGFLSAFPLVAKVMAPRRFAQLTAALNEWFLPVPPTELQFMRQDRASQDRAEGLLNGFTAREKADRVASVLGDAGLRDNFSPIVIVLGHGSTYLNNPHQSSHDCGACGGRRGGPNARIFAAMANLPHVREQLASRGIHIPPDTWFIGGYHDTCHEGIDLYDTAKLPAELHPHLERVRKALEEARARSAQERARRFESALPNVSPQQALLHVEERAEHLAEPRAEYGHCTNAVAIVGRRSLTRGLFLDRRAFLVSYDATLDTEDQALASLLDAVVPVCSGISLEYYFSRVDNERYGCGTKLPHNVTGLVGVMNGATSDLRTGLPWQMVEIHEPVRILFIVETTPERVLRVMHANSQLKELLENHWLRLTTIDPYSGQAFAYEAGHFVAVPPADRPLVRVKRSADWFAGKQEHLPLAEVEA